MRKLKYIFLSMTIASLVFTGCEEYDGGENPEYEHIALSDYSLSLTVTDVLTVRINNPGSGYQVASQDSTVAIATIVNEGIQVEALKVGRTIIILKDEFNKRAKVEVAATAVQPLKLENETLEIGLGFDEKPVTKLVRVLTGNLDYAVISSDTEFVTAKMEGDSLISVTGLTEGHSVITVTDRKGKEAHLAVDVLAPSYDLEVDVNPEELITINKNEPAVTIHITGGNGGYQVQSSDDNVVLASVSDELITLNRVKDGCTTVTLTDRKGRKIVFSVCVPFDLEDPTERVYWDDYRADVINNGEKGTFIWGTTKTYQWEGKFNKINPWGYFTGSDKSQDIN